MTEEKIRLALFKEEIYWWKYMEKRQVIYIFKPAVLQILLLLHHLLNLQLIILFHYLLKSTMHNKNGTTEWTKLRQSEFSVSS